jgi:hypothetical protein
MGKYNFRIVGSSFIKELDVEVGQSPRLESFKQPSFELSVDKIIMNESGVYKTAMYFNQIGTIDSILPVDIEDAYEKLLLLVVNFNLGGATPQIESYSLTEVKTSGTWIDGKPIYRLVKLDSDPFPTDTETEFPTIFVGQYRILEYTKTTD